MNFLKGESSYWINQQGFCEQKFEWQNDYFAVSVSEPMLDKARNYIKTQEAHHESKTFLEESDEFSRKFGFKKIGQNQNFIYPYLQAVLYAAKPATNSLSSVGETKVNR